MARSAIATKTKQRLPLVLAILDGWGIGSDNKKINPLLVAKTPFLNGIMKQYPQAKLQASGKAVGLPKGQDGNSEAGHLNLGAGRVVKQDSVVISESIKDGTFFKNNILLQAVEHVKKNKSQLHLMGLLSNFNSGHSSPDHFHSLLKFLHQQKVHDIFIHFFTDGRDTPKYDALKFLQETLRRFKNHEQVVSMVGRFYAMDRKKNWARTETAYDLLTLGQGMAAEDAAQAIRHAYNRGESDEYISPTVIIDKKSQKPVGVIKDKDAVIFFNLRSDRARQMAKPFVQKGFEGLNKGAFKRKKVLRNLFFVALTDFGPDLGNIYTAYPSPDLKDTLPLALKNFRQLYITEQEKYTHVTYFFNGGYADPVAGEHRILVPSPRIDKYDKTPGMSAHKITRAIKERLAKKKFDIVVVNYTNPDMIGHTGNFAACVKAMEIVDECLQDLGHVLRRCRGTMVITSDHGNVEELVDAKTGEINTDHSGALVPVVITNAGLKNKKFRRTKGLLADVAPTILDWLNIPKPAEMTGRSLFRK